MAASQLEQIINEIETAADDPLEILAVARNRFGRQHANYDGLNAPRDARRETPFFASTYPQQWQDRYLECGYVRCDPSVDAILPIDWPRIDRKTGAAKKVFGEANEFGVRETGLTIPVRGLYGDLAIVTAAGDFSAKGWEDFKAENLAALNLISASIHLRMLAMQKINVARPRLTKRETECLYWASQGKTCADAADILKISAYTARCHLNSARMKLDSLTIAHCVAKAISLRLIPPVV